MTPVIQMNVGTKEKGCLHGQACYATSYITTVKRKDYEILNRQFANLYFHTFK